MKITLSIYNQKTLENTAKLIDFAVLMVPKYAQVYEVDFNIDEAIKYCEENHVGVILSISRIFMEDELDEIKSFIQKYNYKFLVSDLGVAQLFDELGRTNDVVFDSPTMVCNSIDLDMYKSFGFDAISISNEIPLEDVQNAYKDTNANIYYQLFGRKLMFYSKRHLLSCYEKHSSSKFDRNNLFIKEEKREDLMPIIENENGYFVYRGYYLNLLNEIKNLDFLKYGYIESLTLTNDQLMAVLKGFRDYLDNKITLEQANNDLNNLGLNYSNQFLYNDTIHIKEKIINEKN